ncbi:MAG: RNA polymerase sigma factor [Gemmataceae bacterium]|nr:RNA polymerase sigma factor [Gemmataceae bacterium]
MASSFEPSTSITLLGRLRQQPADEAAWQQFVSRYDPAIRCWCRHWGLQDADAQDVTQNVLLMLATQMRRFEYQPSGRFRAWLRTVAYRAWCDFLGSRKQAGSVGSGDSTVHQLLDSVAAREDFLQHLEDEANRELLAEAMAQVRQRVQPHTWEAFRLVALEGLSAAEAAARLHMSPGSVFVARCRLQKMLQDEVARLDGHEDKRGLDT